MTFGEFIMVGFSESQMKRIRRRFKPSDTVNMDLPNEIADLTGYSVGVLVAPGEPLKIIRLQKEA